MYNNGADIPEYSQLDGTTDRINIGKYGNTYTSVDDMCKGSCDDGTIDIAPVKYTKSGDKVLPRFRWR